MMECVGTDGLTRAGEILMGILAAGVLIDLSLLLFVAGVCIVSRLKRKELR